MKVLDDPNRIRAEIESTTRWREANALSNRLLRAWRRAGRAGDREREQIACSLAAAAIRRTQALYAEQREPRP